MARIVFLDPAAKEVLEAAAYYEDQASGLGNDFLGEVQSALHGTAENPRAGWTFRLNIHRWLVRRFPFGILHSINPQEIVIVAVMHLRRRPGYWENRIDAQ